MSVGSPPPGDRPPRPFVVVANRLPVRRVRHDGEQQWATSPGGLVSALAPVMRELGEAAWVGWTGAAGEAPAPFDHEGIELHPVSLSRADVQLFYEGFSNGTLWPLYHDALEVPQYHRTWWDAYVNVNQRFATAAAATTETGGAVWVQDYQLQLVPALLREMRPDLRIGWFDHIPFPPRELFIRMPWRSEIAAGLLGADLLGFQTMADAANFRRAALGTTGAKAARTQRTVLYEGREIALGAFPVGIDVDRIGDLANQPSTIERAVEIRASLGDPACVLLGVDRLDYTKGIEVRLRAYRELLDEDRLSADDTVMIQVAEPSRSNVVGYADIRGEIERLVGDINGNFATMGKPAVHYLHQSQSIDELVAMYRTADVMIVTPFRDGMNLVAKEYVASRADEGGALVLSEFAGAASELRQALLVNPHDIRGMKDTIEAAVKTEPAEQRRRMRPMRRTVMRSTADHWARSFIDRLLAL